LNKKQDKLLKIYKELNYNNKKKLVEKLNLYTIKQKDK
jgi:hypothetical protein